MSVRVVSGFSHTGREWQQVLCSCGWSSAKLWADKHAVVTEAWAVHETTTCGGGPVMSVRDLDKERVRLRGELDRLDRERAFVAAALEGLAS